MSTHKDAPDTVTLDRAAYQSVRTGLESAERELAFDLEELRVVDASVEAALIDVRAGLDALKGVEGEET